MYVCICIYVYLVKKKSKRMINTKFSEVVFSSVGGCEQGGAHRKLQRS